jgi:hypothetical protein
MQEVYRREEERMKTGTNSTREESSAIITQVAVNLP